MTIDEAFIAFANRPEETRPGLLPYFVVMERSDGTAVDAWGAFAASLAALSGQLEDATTDQDLDDAVRHGRRLLRMRTFSSRAVRDQAFWLLNKLITEQESKCSDG